MTGDRSPAWPSASSAGRAARPHRLAPTVSSRRRRSRSGPMRLTVLGLRRQLPRPRIARAPRTWSRRTVSGCCSTSALARSRRCSATPALTAVDAILLTHLHCDHMLDAVSYVVVRRYAPDGPYPPLPVYAPAGARSGWPAPTARRRGPARRRLHVLRAAAGQLPDRPVHGHRRPGQPSGGDLWRTAGARRRASGLLGRHRALRGADQAGPGRRRVPVRGELPRRRGQPAGSAPDRAGSRRGRHQGRRRPAGADPSGDRLGQRGRDAYEAARVSSSPARSRSPAPARASRSDPQYV